MILYEYGKVDLVIWDKCSGIPVPFDYITGTAVSSEMQLQSSGLFPPSSGSHFYQ